MAKPIMKCELTDGSVIEKTGIVANLDFGGTKLKCFIHDETLSHFSSGRRICAIQPAIIKAMCRLSPAHVKSWSSRQKAQYALDCLLEGRDVKMMLPIIHVAPVLNP